MNVTLDCAIDVMVLETSPGVFLAPPFPPSCRFHAALRYVAVLCTNPSGSDQRHTSPALGTIWAEMDTADPCSSLRNLPAKCPQMTNLHMQPALKRAN